MRSAFIAEPAVRPFFWSTERFVALVESGIIPEGRGIELVGGQVIETMPQGRLHLFIFRALQRAFAAMGGFESGLVVEPTIALEDGNVYEPELAFLGPEAEAMPKLPEGSDVLFIVEVAVSSLSQDLGPKKSAYAAASIPHYWVVDGVKGGIWVFADPAAGVYQSEHFVGSDALIDVPVLGKSLNLASIFPVSPEKAVQRGV